MLCNPESSVSVTHILDIGTERKRKGKKKSVWVHKRNLDVIMCRVPEFHIGGYINTERSDWVSSLTGCAFGMSSADVS